MQERQRMRGDSTVEIAFDGTYDKRNNHATRITAIGINIKNGQAAWRKHYNRDPGTSRLTKEISYQDYKGTAQIAEGELLQDMFTDFRNEGMPITHITIDGDQEFVANLSFFLSPSLPFFAIFFICMYFVFFLFLRSLAQLGRLEGVQVRRDPNHYSKKLIANGKALSSLYEEVKGIGKLLKVHFLATVKMKLDEHPWKSAWFSFIGHNFYNDHSLCMHNPLPDNYIQNYFDVPAIVIHEVEDLLQGIADECSLFLHHTHTNKNESANGSCHARADKRKYRSLSGCTFLLYVLSFYCVHLA